MCRGPCSLEVWRLMCLESSHLRLGFRLFRLLHLHCKSLDGPQAPGLESRARQRQKMQNRMGSRMSTTLVSTAPLRRCAQHLRRLLLTTATATTISALLLRHQGAKTMTRRMRSLLFSRRKRENCRRQYNKTMCVLCIHICVVEPVANFYPFRGTKTPM